MKKSATHGLWRIRLPRRKKTATAIHAEITREVTSLLSLIFAERKQTGGMDLEAAEMALRAAMHRAGAAALTQLLQFPEPATDQRAIPCPCGHQARYRERRTRRLLTAVGAVELSRPWYLCPHCHNGQFPVDRQLDVEHGDCSPGVRHMQALVGQDAPFDHGRQQMKLLAGLEVTAKSVERTAEAIGTDIVRREHHEIRQIVQLDLPIVLGEPIPILYVQMDGTGVPVVKKETEGRKEKRTANQHTRAKPNSAACSRKPQTTKRATPSAIQIRRPTPELSKPPRSLANASTARLGTLAGAAWKKR